ncbi:hypothetical protein V6N12_047665 [Hibiscus sabdariffa]|uniref:Uncharacterized protein n=1 Tax=Hibiscus sabdariffa TaxID=183260 RepID=A0ABR2CTN2_9ROSI
MNMIFLTCLFFTELWRIFVQFQSTRENLGHKNRGCHKQGFSRGRGFGCEGRTMAPALASLSASERGRMMMKFADLIEIAALDSINGGKLVEIPAAANTVRYFAFAGAADKIHGTVLKATL